MLFAAIFCPPNSISDIGTSTSSSTTRIRGTAFLRTAGHDVFCAASAEQARRLLADKVIDLALVDCLMSGERGIFLAEHAVRLGVPTILTSGDPHYLDARPEGRFPFLPKPFRLSALDELISRTLQAWSR